MKTKQEVLEVVGQWLDAVCQSPSGDFSLKIEKTAYGRNEATGVLAEVAFVVKAETVIGGAKLQMAPQIVQAPPLVTPK